MTNLPNLDNLTRRQLFKLTGSVIAGTAITACEPVVNLSNSLTTNQSQEYTRQTATAMVPKTAETMLNENHAPKAVLDRTAQLTFEFKSQEKYLLCNASAFIAETFIFNGTNYALVITAGHTFTDHQKQEITPVNPQLHQPQFNDKHLEVNLKNPNIITDFTYSGTEQNDFGLLLVPVSSDLKFSPLPISLSQNQGNLYGLGFPSSAYSVFESIPYIVHPNEYQLDKATGLIRLSSSTSPGSSGATLLNDKAEMVAIITGLPADANHTVCTLIPLDYNKRREIIIAKLSQTYVKPPKS